MSCHPRCPRGKGNRVRGSASRPPSEPTLPSLSLQAAGKAILQVGCKISIVPIAYSPTKSHAELSDICLFACFGKRKKDQI